MSEVDELRELLRSLDEMAIGEHPDVFEAVNAAIAAALAAMEEV